MMAKAGGSVIPDERLPSGGDSMSQAYIPDCSDELVWTSTEPTVCPYCESPACLTRLPEADGDE